MKYNETVAQVLCEVVWVSWVFLSESEREFTVKLNLWQFNDNLQPFNDDLSCDAFGKPISVWFELNKVEYSSH